MIKKIIILFSSLLVIAIFTGIYLINPRRIESSVYDLFHEQKEVSTFTASKIILSDYSIVPINKLPKHVLKETGLSSQNFQDRFSKMQFYVIPKKDIYRKIYLNQRIVDFFSLHNNQRYTWFSAEEVFYVSLSDDILKTLFDLHQLLSAKGYKANAVHVISAYRHPSRNDAVGGATNSIHLYGNAMDIKIGDIDGDKRIDSKDKNIVYSILDKSLIRNKGGVGFYPGTMVLHMDVRGTRARWDNYRRKT